MECFPITRVSTPGWPYLRANILIQTARQLGEKSPFRANQGFEVTGLQVASAVVVAPARPSGAFLTLAHPPGHHPPGSPSAELAIRRQTTLPSTPSSGWTRCTPCSALPRPFRAPSPAQLSRTAARRWCEAAPTHWTCASMLLSCDLVSNLASPQTSVRCCIRCVRATAPPSRLYLRRHQRRWLGWRRRPARCSGRLWQRRCLR
jgi:hypothetical protein